MRKRNRLVGIIMTIALMVALLPATAFAAEGELWIGDNDMTATHNISGSTGTATFDPITNTLTLDNFVYTDAGKNFKEDCAAVIYSTLDTTLNIKINGISNVLTNNSTTAKNVFGIYITGTGGLAISSEDEGRLTAVAGDADSISHGIWCNNGGINVDENTELIAIGGEANISRGICVFDKIINNGGIIEGKSGKAGSFSHGISAGSIESNNTNSKTIGTAGSAAESAGIRIWDSTTFAKGYMKGVGGDVDINNNDVSYGIYVGDADSEKLTIVKGATVEAEGETAAFNKAYAVADPGAVAPGTAAQPDSSPNTGDNSNMILWLALLLVSGGAIIVAVVLGRKRK